MPATNSSTFALTLPTDLEIVITREFNAPPQLVFEAFTKAEHVTRWWGCRELQLHTCEMDLRPGGAYRYVLHGPDGQEWGFHGVYLEISPPSRLVYTFVFEPYAEHDSVVTMTLEDLGGRTRYTEVILHKTVEGRDGHVQSGMEQGAMLTLDRLAELLEMLK